MRGAVYGVLAGLVVAGVLVGVFELAGGDATLVVMLVLLTTYVAIRFDRAEAMYAELLEEIGHAQAECGNTFPLAGGQFKTCVRRLDHHNPWHRSADGVQWLMTTGPGGGGGGRGSRLGDTESQA